MLSTRMKKKWKIGDNGAFTLMNRPKRKFEKSIMVIGGISFYGLSDLMLLQGTMNNLIYPNPSLFINKAIIHLKN